MFLLAPFLPASATQAVDSTTWAATDALGRTLPGYAECGPPKLNRFVGIFYFLTDLEGPPNPPYNNTEIGLLHPKNGDYGPPYSKHFWGKPWLGYYRSDDPFVLRKHIEMLSDAGVDVLLFDVTNGPTYPQTYRNLFAQMEAVKKLGWKVPKVAFFSHAQTPAVVTKLWNAIYHPGKWKDLWFTWLGKPLLIADPNQVPATMRAFFTIRDSWAWTRGASWFGDGHDKWPWLDHTPQQPGWHTNPDTPEEISVAVAEHPTSNIGRSFHNGSEPAITHSTQGLYFQEQWDQALKVAPPFVWVTGWNEWTATAFPNQGQQPFMGKPGVPGSFFFVDEFNEEYSRDSEPEDGRLGDDYYYQLVANIRRYKGVSPPPPLSAPRTISFAHGFADWNHVQPTYRDETGDTMHRNWPGYGTSGPYVNSSGRNDLATMKVTNNADHLFFLAQCASAITAPRGKFWMALFLNVHAPASATWNGYSYVINRIPPAHGFSFVQKWDSATEKWQTVAKVPMKVVGKQLEVSLPYSVLGWKAGSKPDIELKWADNVPDNGNILSFIDQGDVAPNGRFNYVYKR